MSAEQVRVERAREEAKLRVKMAAGQARMGGGS